MSSYLNFKEICEKVEWKPFLDRLCAGYSETNSGELKGYVEENGNKLNFIVNPAKGVFKTPSGSHTGSQINLLMALRLCGYREAAQWLKSEFIDEKPPPEEKKVPDLKLEYKHLDGILTEEEATKFEVGYCGHGILRGRIAITIRDHQGEKVAYTGRAIKDDQQLYLFPKGYKQDHIYLLNALEDKKWAILTADPLDCWNVNLKIPHRGISLLSLNMTDAQAFLLAQIKYVMLLHPSLDNIALRLCKHTAIFCPKLPKAVRHMDASELNKLIRK
jgi:hypothetical protein